MSLTGLFLISFLAVHLTGNFQLFKNDQGLSFNTYAVFMTSNPFIKFISYGLYATILFHAFWGLALTAQNRSARPKGYAVSNSAPNVSWTSKNMALLGVLVLGFIFLHMGNFWFNYKFGNVPYKVYTEDLMTGQITAADFNNVLPDHKMEQFTDAQSRKRITIVRDLYAVVATTFKNPIIIACYLLGLAALLFHLMHGFQSAFQSLGINHPKFTPTIRIIGMVFAVVVQLAFASMPVFFFFFK